MAYNYLPLILLAVGGIVLTTGDLVMKYWVKTNTPWFYILGLGIYLIGLNFLAFSFKFKNIAVASVIFVIFNVLTLLLFSWFYFKEKLSCR
jgi:multidrug transporter EmrE-like cation transporter